MKILNILFNYKKSAHDNQVLGVERCFLDYTKYLRKFGHDVISVGQEGISYKDRVKEVGPARFMRAFALWDLVTMARMVWLFFRFGPEIVVCHSKKALYFARIAKFVNFSKAPLVVINHGVRVEKFLKADYVFAVNSYFTNKLVEAGMDEKRAIAVPNMIEVEEGFEGIVKPAFRKPVRLGGLARLYPEKNFDKILRAMKILRDEMGIESEFVIGGVGPQQESLEALAKELGLEKSFRILGWTEDKKAFFEGIDIFVLPSWGETFGIVLLEAMLYSTPIVASDSWGPDEIIEDGVDGMKVSKDDAEAMPRGLAKAVRKFVEDEEFARGVAVRAKEKFFEKYEAGVVTKGLIEVFEGILRGDR